MARSEIIVGDCMDVLPTLPAKSVHVCICSPPYWGLRSYGIEGRVWGGGQDVCFGANAPNQAHVFHHDNDDECIYCGAWRGTLGSEPTPELFVQQLQEHRAAENFEAPLVRKDGTPVDVLISSRARFAGSPFLSSAAKAGWGAPTITFASSDSWNR